MWEMGRTSIGLFVRGKLFASRRHALGLALLGLGLTALVFVVAAKLGLPVLAATPIAAFAGGMLQPRLYKNLKYR
jgi:hypothetical protein